MKQVYWYSFWSIALFHLLATGGAMLKAFSMGMSRFDTGEPITHLEEFLMAMWKFLSFPIVTLCYNSKFWNALGILGWTPVILNSMLWAGVIVGIIMAIGKLRQSQNNTPEGIRRPADGSPKPSV